MNVTFSPEEKLTLYLNNNTLDAPRRSSQMPEDILSTICYKYLGPTLCVFGVVGNLLSLFVLTRDRLKDGPYHYLRALAVTDMLALLVSFPFMVFSMGSTSYYWKWYDIYVFLPSVNVFTASSVWITVIMTIERFIVVKFPLWARWRCTRNGALIRIWITIILSVLASIPRYFVFRIKAINEGFAVSRTSFNDSRFYQGMDYFCIASLHFLPLVILGVINVFLIYEVQRARAVREELNIRNNRETEFQKDQRRFTITLISIVVLSLCFIVPASVTDILLYSNLNLTPKGEQIWKSIRNVSNVLLWCSLSFNFLLYCAFNRRFVRVLRNSFGRSYFRFRNYSKSKRTTRSYKSSNSTII